MHQLPGSELRVLEVSLRLTCCEHGMGMGELPIRHTLLSRFETLTIRALSSKGLHRDTDLCYRLQSGGKLRELSCDLAGAGF